MVRQGVHHETDLCVGRGEGQNCGASHCPLGTPNDATISETTQAVRGLEGSLQAVSERPEELSCPKAGNDGRSLPSPGIPAAASPGEAVGSP
jgi:hypothetical protein